MVGYIGTWVQRLTSPAVAAAPALGGDSYWLADGGKWFVHGAGLQLEAVPRGRTDYVGELTWNAYGAVVTGHIHLSFTSNADGSLTGTYIDSATYTYAQGNASDYPEFTPDPSVPQQGQVIKLVPIAPHHAKTVYLSGGSPEYGNTNWCQADLPDASQYCGA